MKQTFDKTINSKWAMGVLAGGGGHPHSVKRLFSTQNVLIKLHCFFTLWSYTANDNPMETSKVKSYVQYSFIQFQDATRIKICCLKSWCVQQLYFPYLMVKLKKQIMGHTRQVAMNLNEYKCSSNPFQCILSDRMNTACYYYWLDVSETSVNAVNICLTLRRVIRKVLRITSTVVWIFSLQQI